MTTINGMRIVEDSSMVVSGGVRIVDRTWVDRLFSFPWAPWHSRKLVPNYYPDPNVLKMPDQFGNPMVVGHPETIRRLQERMEANQ